MSKESFDYKKAGVDLKAADRAVDEIKQMVRTTFRREVVTEIGGFAGLFAPSWQNFREPVLAAAADGVGTKLKIAFQMKKHDTVGIDCVAMCVNDLLVHGAEPLFFLDYLATGRLEEGMVREIISGVVEGCRQAGCALLGGETAEMPGFYPPGEYDLAGFALGIVEREKIITGKDIAPGDLVIGLASSGLHANGFSLVRKVLLEYAAMNLEESVPQLKGTLGEELLKPTIIYVPFILPLLKESAIKGLANITGGGLILNPPRILPPGLKAVLEKGSWEVPFVFSLIQEKGNVEEKEMFRTFNMGIGMVAVVSPDNARAVLSTLREQGQKAWEIGIIKAGESEKPYVEISG